MLSDYMEYNFKIRIKLTLPLHGWRIIDNTYQTFDPLSGSNAEKRCLLPHPTKMVIPIRRDGDGTHFVCLCCRTEFKLPKMTFYEAGVNSMLTGYCFIGQHTSDENDIGLYKKQRTAYLMWRLAVENELNNV